MTTTDDLYIAADERARDARRAGLQAKKDEQPLNTTRSYASKQREWKARRPSLLSPFPSLALPRSTILIGLANARLVELVPHAARCAGRLPAQLARRRARHAGQARSVA
jgi:hypothetical protein